MLIFTRVLPFETTIRLIDVLLFDGYDAIWSFALSIFRLFESQWRFSQFV